MVYKAIKTFIQAVIAMAALAALAIVILDISFEGDVMLLLIGDVHIDLINIEWPSFEIWVAWAHSLLEAVAKALR